MFKEKILLSVVVISVAFIAACGQNKDSNKLEEAASDGSEITHSIYQEPHQYGGWFCPDNLGGFPPMDIQDVDKLTVVAHRLPTMEETNNGTSLIYIDTVKFPDARPLEMKLPCVARKYSEHNGLNELIIVIQAVIIGKDTVVGYRFPCGGNGSAWLGEVSFLSDKEVKALRPAPIVYLHSNIKASKAKVWKAITSTDYAKELGNRFNEQVFFLSDWTDDSEVHLKDETEGTKAYGIVTTLWGNLYLQIDYDYSGFQYSEKIFLYEDEQNQSSDLQFVAGPYPKDFAAQKVVWENWLQKVKSLSEMK